MSDQEIINQSIERSRKALAASADPAMANEFDAIVQRLAPIPQAARLTLLQTLSETAEDATRGNFSGDSFGKATNAVEKIPLTYWINDTSVGNDVQGFLKKVEKLAEKFPPQVQESANNQKRGWRSQSANEKVNNTAQNVIAYDNPHGLEFNGPVTPDFQNGMLQTHTSLRPAIRDFLHGLNYTFAIGQIQDDNAPENSDYLKGISNQDDARVHQNQSSGHFDPHKKQVSVTQYEATSSYPPDFGVRPEVGYSNNWRKIPIAEAAQAYRHEVYHALNHSLGYISESPSFKAAYQADIDRNGGPEALRRKGYGYFIQDALAGRGRDEIFAEMGDELNGGGVRRGKVTTVFTDCAQWMEEFEQKFERAYASGPKAVEDLKHAYRYPIKEFSPADSELAVEHARTALASSPHPELVDQFDDILNKVKSAPADIRSTLRGTLAEYAETISQVKEGISQEKLDSLFSARERMDSFFQQKGLNEAPLQNEIRNFIDKTGFVAQDFVRKKQQSWLTKKSPIGLEEQDKPSAPPRQQHQAQQTVHDVTDTSRLTSAPVPTENRIVQTQAQKSQSHHTVNLVVDAQFGTDPAVIERIRHSADALRERGIPTIWISMDNRSQLYPPTENWPSASPHTRDVPQLEVGGFFGHAPGTSGGELQKFREHFAQYGPRTDEAMYPKAFFDAFATPDSIQQSGARPHYLEQQRAEHIGGIDNVFHGQTLLDYLKSMGVEQVTIMGGNADVCVTETAMGAARNGMQTTILSDHIIRHTDQARNNPSEQYEHELRTLHDQTLDRPQELIDYPTKDALSAGTMYSDADKAAIRQNLHIDTFENFISALPTSHNVNQPNQQQQTRHEPTDAAREQHWRAEQQQRQAAAIKSAEGIPQQQQQSQLQDTATAESLEALHAQQQNSPSPRETPPAAVKLVDASVNQHVTEVPPVRGAPPSQVAQPPNKPALHEASALQTPTLPRTSTGGHRFGGGANIAMSAIGLYQDLKDDGPKTGLDQARTAASVASGVAGVAEGGATIIATAARAAPTVAGTMEAVAPVASRAGVVGAIAVGGVGVVQGAVEGDTHKMVTSAGTVAAAFAGAQAGTALGATLAGPYGAVAGGVAGGLAGAMGFEGLMNVSLRPTELTAQQKAFFAFVDDLPAKVDASMSPELKALVDAKANMAKAQTALDNAMRTIPPTNPGVARNALEVTENSFTDRFEELQKNGGLQKVVVELTQRNHPELIQQVSLPTNDAPGSSSPLLSTEHNPDLGMPRPREESRAPLRTALAMAPSKETLPMPDRQTVIPAGLSPAP